MPPRGIRFRPPERPLEPGARWALARAFWSPGAPSPAAEPETALCAVERLRLGARVASRIAGATLTAELGAAGAARLREERLAAAARAMHVRTSLREVLAVARRLGVAPVLLKLAALDARGALADGSRGASDADVLLDRPEAIALRDALRAEDWRASDAREEEHHLAAVCRPRGVPLEIHTKVPGIRLAGGVDSADAGGLERAGLLERATGELAGARVPVAEVIAAHLLVHGLAQHGASPRAYPMFQPFADAIDLGWPGEPGPEAGVRAIATWVERSVDRPTLEAAARLCSRLAAGDAALLEETAAASAESALLHHCVWGMLDEDYRDSLRLSAVASPLSDLPPWRASLRELRRAVAPRASELIAIYGGRPSFGRILWLRLIRPLDLVARTVRTMRSRAQVRRG